MIALCIAAALALSPAALQDDEPPELDPQVVAAAVEDLEQGLKSREPAERAAAVERNAALQHADVIELIGRYLKDDEPEVQIAALEALRPMEHADSLAVLHRAFKREKGLRENPEVFALLFKAIAQHGDPESVELLGDDLFAVTDRLVIRARILGLGNIRCVESVEELMGLMRSARRQHIQPYMQEFRLALKVLTGTDRGGSQEAWNSWWNDVKKTLVIDPAPPQLSKKEQRAWDTFWGIEREEPRDKKKGGDTGDGDAR